MMGLAEFERVRNDPLIQVEIARFYDNRDVKNNTLRHHEIGWTIKVVEPAQKWAFGYFHVHWTAPLQHATYPEISAHFKESHKSNKTLNKNGASGDLKLQDAARLYNGFGLLQAKWDDRSPSKPTGVAGGWTSITKRITLAMVEYFRNTNNEAALRMLGKNPLYDLNMWDKEAYTSFLWWMATGA